MCTLSMDALLNFIRSLYIICFSNHIQGFYLCFFLVMFLMLCHLSTIENLCVCFFYWTLTWYALYKKVNKSHIYCNKKRYRGRTQRKKEKYRSPGVKCHKNNTNKQHRPKPETEETVIIQIKATNPEEREIVEFVTCIVTSIFLIYINKMYKLCFHYSETLVGRHEHFLYPSEPHNNKNKDFVISIICIAEAGVSPSLLQCQDNPNNGGPNCKSWKWSNV